MFSIPQVQNITTPIKSVQRGTASLTTFTNDVTISSVKLEKSILLVNATYDAFNKIPSATLLNATTIRFVVATSGGSVDWQVVEFN